MAFTTTINGHTYTSDPMNTSVPDGYRFIGYGYLTAFPNFAADLMAVAQQALGYAGAASTSAGSASDSAGVAS